MSTGVEGMSHANRELPLSTSYIPSGDPGPYGGGTYTTHPTEPTLRDYENIFGPSARDIKDDMQKYKRHGRWHLPDILKGPNPWMTDRIDGLITDATNSPFTSVILPYKYFENVDGKIKWNVWSFDEAMASRVPYESAARTLTQSKRSYAGYAVRHGLAINLEHNFMMTPKGRENFQNQLNQLIGSIQYSNDLDVHIALVLAPSHEKEMRSKYAQNDDNPTQICRQFVDLFGFMQKNVNALDIMIEEAKYRLKAWGGPMPDFMLTNSKLTFQMTMTPDKTNYVSQGPDGLKRLKQGPEMDSYRGLKIIHSRMFSLETGQPPRDILRRRVRVAEYYRITPHQDNMNRDFEFYNEARDTWFSMSFKDLLKAANYALKHGDTHPAYSGEDQPGADNHDRIQEMLESNLRGASGGSGMGRAAASINTPHLGALSNVHERDVHEHTHGITSQADKLTSGIASGGRLTYDSILCNVQRGDELKQRLAATPVTYSDLFEVFPPLQATSYNLYPRLPREYKLGASAVISVYNDAPTQTLYGDTHHHLDGLLCKRLSCRYAIPKAAILSADDTVVTLTRLRDDARRLQDCVLQPAGANHEPNNETWKEVFSTSHIADVCHRHLLLTSELIDAVLDHANSDKLQDSTTQKHLWKEIEGQIALKPTIRELSVHINKLILETLNKTSNKHCDERGIWTWEVDTLDTMDDWAHPSCKTTEAMFYKSNELPPWLTMKFLGQVESATTHSWNSKIHITHADDTDPNAAKLFFDNLLQRIHKDPYDTLSDVSRRRKLKTGIYKMHAKKPRAVQSIPTNATKIPVEYNAAEIDTHSEHGQRGARGQQDSRGRGKRAYGDDDLLTVAKTTEIVVIRPNIEHNMLGIIMGLGGEQLGSTLWGQTELSVYDDSMHGIWGMSYKYHERAIVFNEKNLIRLWDIAYDGYNGGKDDTYVNWLDEAAVKRFREETSNVTKNYQAQSMMVMAFVHMPDEEITYASDNQLHKPFARDYQRNWPSPIVFDDGYDYSIQADHGSNSQTLAVGYDNIHKVDVRDFRVFNKPLYAAYHHYRNKMPSFRDLHELRKSAGVSAQENDTPTDSLAFQGSMRVRQGGVLIEEIQGSGHHGPDFAGVSSVRAGKGYKIVGQPGLQRTV